MKSKRLTRSENKILAGVCGGIAEWADLDPTLVRIGYLLVSILSAAFPGTLVYIILWIVMPTKEYLSDSERDNYQSA